MSETKKTLSLLLFFSYLLLLTYCREFQEIKINSKIEVEIYPENDTVFNFTISENELAPGNFLVFSTKPEDYLKPAFIYISSSPEISADKRDFSSQESGKNIIFVNKSYIQNQEGDSKNLYLFLNTLVETKVELEVHLISNINLEEYQGIRPRLSLSDIVETNVISYTYKTTENGKNKKILFYSLGEYYKYFNMRVEYISESSVKTILKTERKFENGYGSIVDFNSSIFNGVENPKINIVLYPSDNKYINSKVDIGYEIIDEKEENKREIEIMEHIYGMTENSETCYKFKENINETKKGTMLINIFTQPIEFNIKDANNSKIYSLSIFNNYFIRFPENKFKKENYFCFKHITPREEEEEVYGEVSYDFQIYNDEDLNNNQLFVMPLINGKIYTHSLNRGDNIVYRHNFYGKFTENNEKDILSVNMLKIRGNPILRGLGLTRYPDDYKEIDGYIQYLPELKIHPLNMYNIIKRVNAEGNTKISENGEALFEQREQYLAIVSCESKETDPNNGECKYTIEINNERDEIQLISDSVFATSIINPINYFLIKLSDYSNIKYLKIYFTVLVGNAELYIYEDSTYENEIKNYNYSHIHRKEIIEISENVKENYYLIVKCQDMAFIQLKYQTNKDYKGYNNLIPNEMNIEPINIKTNSHYNMYNPNYYYPLENETRNNNFYYKLVPLECSMSWSDGSQSLDDLFQYDFEMEKNKLYYYLSSYGFYSKVNKFTQTSSDDDKCSLIIYNGEKSENIPILAISDMPHISNLNFTTYKFPVIYDVNDDRGIGIEFKIYNDNGKAKCNYRISYYMDGNAVSITKDIPGNGTFYIEEIIYKNYLKENNFGALIVKIFQSNQNSKCSISTNFMSSRISPEYIQMNIIYDFSVKMNSSRIFYSQINKNTTGYLKFDFEKGTQNYSEIYAKIVKKDEIEEGYNWNKRVKLPEKDDENLLNINNSLIVYDQNDTEKCDNGCEIYIRIKSSHTSNEILLTLTFKEGEYKEETPIETDGEKNEDDGDKYLWVKIVIPIISIIIIGLVVFFIIRKRRKNDFYSDHNDPIGINISLNNMKSEELQ